MLRFILCCGWLVVQLCFFMSLLTFDGSQAQAVKLAVLSGVAFAPYLMLGA